MPKQPFGGITHSGAKPLMETFHQAVQLHQRGDLAEARRLYKIVLRKQPDHFDALHFMCVIEAQRGLRDKAEQLIRKALHVNPMSAEAHSNLGNVQRDMGKLKEALASYDRSL